MTNDDVLARGAGDHRTVLLKADAPDRRKLMPVYNRAMLTLARESRGWTKTELSRRVDMPLGTISKIESGALAMNDTTAAAMARALYYPVSFFKQNDMVYPLSLTSLCRRGRTK